MHPRAFLLGCSLAAALFSQELDTARIDAAVLRSMEVWKVPGAAVAVIQDGRTCVRGYGVRARGGSEPVTPATVFAIGSTTKALNHRRNRDAGERRQNVLGRSGAEAHPRVPPLRSGGRPVGHHARSGHASDRHRPQRSSLVRLALGSRGN